VGLYVYFDDALFVSASVPPFEGIYDYEWYNEIYVWPYDTAPHTIRAVVDPLEEVDESDDTNNEKTITEEAPVGMTIYYRSI